MPVWHGAMLHRAPHHYNIPRPSHNLDSLCEEFILIFGICWFLVGAGTQGCATIFHGEVGDESDEDESQGLSHHWMTVFFICRKDQSYEIKLPQTAFVFDVLYIFTFEN